MKFIQQKEFNKIIKENFDYTFDIKEEGLYLIEIIASCKSWKQNLIKFISFFKDDDLTIKVDAKEFPKLNGKKGLFDSEVAWNGNNLKNLSKTNIFAIRLDKGEHTIHFVADQKPFLKKIKNKPHISKIKFKGKKVSYWINKAAIEHFVNPKLLLTKLQAEQRLIKGDKAVNPSKYQLDGAMGVGMLDDGTVIEELQGFINQINYAAKYFRKFYNEAELANFTHENVDGKKLKTVNAATYSLYKYTPHIAGPELVYKVYNGFFNTNDLGGTLQKKENGFIKVKALFILVSLAVILLLASYFFITKNRPIYSWQNKIPLGDNLELITDLKIFKEKAATTEDDLYCGYRFYKIYDSSMKLLLSHNNKIIDSIDLTNPELVMPNLSAEHLTYYKPWDIDNDGIKQEFIVQEYGTCNSNLFSFVKVNKELKKLEKISIHNQSGKENYIISVDIGKNSFKEKNGIIKTRYYDMTNSDISLNGFTTNYYKYSKDNNRLAWLKEKVE